MSDYYILDPNGEPQSVDDVVTWGKWFNTANRHVANTELATGIRISTVFLGIDYVLGIGVDEDGQRIGPILWETMIFAAEWPDLDEQQWRYDSKAAAERGHANAVAMCEAALKANGAGL